MRHKMPRGSKSFSGSSRSSSVKQVKYGAWGVCTDAERAETQRQLRQIDLARIEREIFSKRS